MKLMWKSLNLMVISRDVGGSVYSIGKKINKTK
jgi:hypothetical protein